MKKIILFIIFLCVLISFPLTASADEYNDYLNSFDLSSFDKLDDGTKELLDTLSVSDFDFEKITEISITDIFKYIYDVILKKADGPIKSGITVVAFVILSSFFKSFSSQLNKSSIEGLYSSISNIIISVFLVLSISNCLSLAGSTIKLCADFTFAFFPAFCIIAATSGTAMTGISVNTTLLILAQALNFISSYVFVPVTNCFMALGICSSIRKELNLGGIVSAVKSLITTAISTLSAAFVSILSIKTAVASRADAIGLRSVRFAINSVVPVIGSSISEGLLSIQSYSSLIKTSVGIVGIIAVSGIFLPAIIEVTIWRFSLSLSGMFAQIFSDDGAYGCIRVFKDVLLIINVILILSMVTTIISIGILVAAKTVS